MTPAAKYKTATSFRMALQDKLNQISKDTGQDIQRLYRQVANSRLLARLFASDDIEWALKGGHALELRLQKSRATKDLDLTLKDSKVFGSNETERHSALRDILIDKSQQDLGDFFTFTISAPTLELDGAPYGGSRFAVTCQIAGKIFSKFTLDIGIGDVWLAPQSEIVSLGEIEALGFEPLRVRIISLEQHIAEKVHALTLPRKQPNSRVRDLVDLYLIFKLESIDKEQLKVAMEKTFERRGTHPLPAKLPKPETSWSAPLTQMMKTLDEDDDINSVYNFVDERLTSIVLAKS